MGWDIRGYDGAIEFFRFWYSGEAVTEQNIKHLLQLLASRHLTESEILSAVVSQDGQDRASHLDIVHESTAGELRLWTAGNPHYAATEKT